MSGLTGWIWPASRLQELAQSTAVSAGFAITPASGTGVRKPAEAIEWIGLETERKPLTGLALRGTITATAPAIIRTRTDEWIGIAQVQNGRAKLVGPSSGARWVKVEELCKLLSHSVEAPHLAGIEEILDAARITGTRRTAARDALLHERLSGRTVAHAWTLRTPPGTSVAKEALHAKLHMWFALFLASNIGQYGAMLLAWWLIGRGALQSQTDWGWVSAWMLALLTVVPLRLYGVWARGRLALGIGGLLKQRLMSGAFRLEPDELRTSGSGQILGRVIEAGQVESLALSGGLGVVTASVELAFAAAVLGATSEGWHLPAALGVWIAVILVLAWLCGKRRAAWTRKRTYLTNELVERMAGHRTRLAQQAPCDWHKEEDADLERYAASSCRLDSIAAVLGSFGTKGWLLAGMAMLLPTLASGTVHPTRLAAQLGGVLLAASAFRQLGASLMPLMGAAIAWKEVASLFHAAAGLRTRGSVSAAPCGSTVLMAEDLSFRYAQRPDPALHQCSLRIAEGDWILLEGASGGGKSTLAAMLAGLRTQSSGLLLADGYDRPTLGEAGWRRKVVTAPQFHENHILAGSLAFNLLLGRQWPPTTEDMEEAEQVCCELGLEPLLERMPAGLMQMVGETGWQLSQGERSRVYLARALLQGGRLMILDESFAALDPETMASALQCLRKRAKTLMLIAHP